MELKLWFGARRALDANDAPSLERVLHCVKFSLSRSWVSWKYSLVVPMERMGQELQGLMVVILHPVATSQDSPRLARTNHSDRYCVPISLFTGIYAPDVVLEGLFRIDNRIYTFLNIKQRALHALGERWV